MVEYRTILLIFLCRMLPPKLDCPGGSELWNNTEHTSDAVICIDELSTCIVYNGLYQINVKKNLDICTYNLFVL
jgi:hypothetical protein